MQKHHLGEVEKKAFSDCLLFGNISAKNEMQSIMQTIITWRPSSILRILTEVLGSVYTHFFGFVVRAW